MEHNDIPELEPAGQEKLLTVTEEVQSEEIPAEEAPSEQIPAEEAPVQPEAEQVTEPKAAPVEPVETVREPVYTRQYTPYEVPTPRAKKQPDGMGRRILSAVVALTLTAGACGITAWSVNRRWEQETAELESAFSAELDTLRGELAQIRQESGSADLSQILENTGISVLTPSQVYAANVSSVVAISNQTTTNVWGQISDTASSGTGFVLTADGYILSNYHVVEDAKKLTVITYSGEEYDAVLVGFDQMNDVAILKVNATGLDPVTIGSSDELIVGDQVVAIGNPLGELTSSLTVGYISAKDRTINTDDSLINMMQTDAAINPGNSGGPLFNMKGEVVGITTAKYSGSTSSGASIEGIGFAIPIADVMSMTEDLIAHGYRTNQAYLGVSVRNLPADTANMYSLPLGSYVVTVTEGSCAENAGILPKDIIIAIGKYPVEDNATLQNALRKFSAGDTTTVTVFRAGAELDLTITFDERPQDPDADLQQPQTEGEMPSAGSAEDWYNYFYPFFGGGAG